jgi:hypothetical protein
MADKAPRMEKRTINCRQSTIQKTNT